MKQFLEDGRHWPLIIVGLLVFNAGAVGWLITKSGDGPSHHVVPDYYRKAVEHDVTMAQDRANLALGWTLRAEPSYGSRGTVLTLTVRDRGGQPVAGAVVSARGFHRAHAAAAVAVEALSETAPGVFAMPLGMARPGLWQLSVTVTRGVESFTAAPLVEVSPVVARGT